MDAWNDDRVGVLERLQTPSHHDCRAGRGLDVPFAEADELKPVSVAPEMAENLRRRGHVEQDDRRKGQRDDSMWSWHQSNDSRYCALSVAHAAPQRVTGPPGHRAGRTRHGWPEIDGSWPCYPSQDAGISGTLLRMMCSLVSRAPALDARDDGRQIAAGTAGHDGRQARACLLRPLSPAGRGPVPPRAAPAGAHGLS